MSLTPPSPPLHPRLVPNAFISKGPHMPKHLWPLYSSGLLQVWEHQASRGEGLKEKGGVSHFSLALGFSFPGSYSQAHRLLIFSIPSAFSKTVSRPPHQYQDQLTGWWFVFASKLKMRLTWQRLLREVVLESLNIMVGLRVMLEKVHRSGNARVRLTCPLL